MSHKKLLKSIRADQPRIYSEMLKEAGCVAKDWKENAIDFLENCSAFYIDGNVGDLPINEIIASAKAMKEAGVFKLPVELTYIEVTVSLDLGNVEKTGRLALFTADQKITGAFLHQHNSPPLEWLAVPVNLSIMSPMLTPINLLRGDFVEKFRKAIEEYAIGAVTALIVLLCTKGIETEFVPTKKCSLISRDAPQDGYTIVHVKRAIERQHLGGTVEERKRTRLHMRRGHVRHQHYGPKLCHEKIIWIEPVLVGYEEEGRIAHDYLVR